MNKYLLFFILILLNFSFLSAQHPYVEGELLVWLHGNSSIESVLRKTPFPTQTERLGQSFNIHLLRFDATEIAEASALEWFKGQEEVMHAQYNFLVESRHTTATLPNDPSFNGQWALNNTGQAGGLIDADIDAPEAWDIETGGNTIMGDTIVIAVVDEGIDTLHQDIRFWINHLEIPYNYIDDDKNGLVDDYLGWNFYDNDPFIPAQIHGTHVAGIAAARGDNNFGIAGVNWDAQVMNIAGSSGNQARVVRAYSYAYDMRKRFDESAGKHGAYVVVINSSFGVNNGNPANFPIWCAMYDSLGARGILNVVSATNSFVNIDAVGDIPSTCPSPFVIAVTATNNQDKLQISGYGKTHVDLGAPGRGILSTIPNNGLSTLTGTSMAAPHVSGAVSLLHAKAGGVFEGWYKAFPDSMALLLKDCILQSTDSLPTLQDSTVTGGRLNLHKSLQHLQALESTLLSCPPAWHIQTSMRTDSSLLLSWRHLLINLPVWIRYREVGSNNWNAFSSTGHHTTLNSLIPCQQYEIQIASICAFDTSIFSNSVFVESEGCCRPPSISEASAITENEATISWEPVYAAQNYVLEYREKDSTTWTSVSLTDTFALLQNLTPCAFFEYRTAVQCDTGLSSFSLIQEFKTIGCGLCQEESYCSSRATDPQEDDWIESFQLDTLINISGPNNGYKSFDDFTIPLEAGSTYSFRLEPGFALLKYSEYWRIWIDYNRDGDFNDTLELAFDAIFTADTAISGQLTIPADLFSGNTRLRVSMQFLFPADPCGNFQFGEVEDYCVHIDGKGEKLENEEMRGMVQVFPNPTDGDLFVIAPEGNVKWELIDVMGRRLTAGYAKKEKFTISMGEMKPGVYILILRGENGLYRRKVVKE